MGKNDLAASSDEHRLKDLVAAQERLSIVSGDIGSLREARQAVRASTEECPTHARDVAELLADELVTNALVHGGGSFVLSIELRDACLHISVSDGSSELPEVLAPSDEREHGRGMAIVAAMASRWGAKAVGKGKVVWFELDLVS